MATSFLFAQNRFVELKKIDKDLKEKSFQFILNALDICDEFAMPRIKSADATTSFRNKFNWQGILDNCNTIESRFGNLKKIELKDIAIDSLNRKHLRYKLTYNTNEIQESQRVLDARVVFSKRDKFHWFYILEYWKDEFEPSKIFSFIETKKAEIKNNQLNQHFEFVKSNYNQNSNLYKKYINNKNLARPNKVDIWLKQVPVEKDSILLKNGSFNKLNLVSKVKTNYGYSIYRYKTKFNKLNNYSEIRLYVDLEERYMGTRVIDVWYDKFEIHSENFEEKVKKDLKQ